MTTRTAARCGLIYLCVFLAALALGQPAHAIRAFGQTAEPPPNGNVTTLYAAASTLMVQGRNEEALQAINETLRIDPNHGAAYAVRSGILGTLQRYEEGVADGDLGIKLSKTPKDKARAAYNKGCNLTFLDRKKEALEAFRLATHFDPTYSMAYFGKAKIYYFLSLYKQARNELDQALKLNIKLGAAWAYLAECEYQLGSVEEGMASAQKAVELAPRDPRSFRARAMGFQLLKRFDEMLADATRTVELQPTRPLSHLLRGRALGLLGRYEEALAEYAAEPDRKAAEPYVNGINQVLHGSFGSGSRVTNPGCDATTLFTPEHLPSETCGFSARIGKEQDAGPATPAKRPKHTVPGVPTRRVPNN